MVQGRNAIKLTLRSDREIVMERAFDAPRELVFEAHSKPEHIRRWWARGNEMPVCEMDFRPSGAWRFVERTPEGEEHGFRGEYREIVRPERIVWTFEYLGYPGHVSVEASTFVEENGQTVLTATAVYDSKEDRDAMLQSGMEEGANQSFDRLAEYLLELQEERAR